MPIKFHPHLDFAHKQWSEIISIGDTVVDATVGNGHDTLFLAERVIRESQGKVFGLDIQETALEKARLLLEKNLSKNVLKRVFFYRTSHETFPEEILSHSVKLLVYNLGYLPGGDKSLTTRVPTTLASLKAGLSLICQGGMISITCYPGHEEGKREREALFSFVKTLPIQEWSVTAIEWMQRADSPSLLLINHVK